MGENSLKLDLIKNNIFFLKIVEKPWKILNVLIF